MQCRWKVVQFLAGLDHPIYSGKTKRYILIVNLGVQIDIFLKNILIMNSCTSMFHYIPRSKNSMIAMI